MLLKVGEEEGRFKERKSGLRIWVISYYLTNYQLHLQRICQSLIHIQLFYEPAIASLTRQAVAMFFFNINLDLTFTQLCKIY